MTTLKPRGAEGGPKRTPPHLGDAWQHKPAYEVEEVIPCLHYTFLSSSLLLHIRPGTVRMFQGYITVLQPVISGVRSL